MATRAKHVGALGVVTNGRLRDIGEQRALGFPVFATGLSCHGAGGFTAPASVGEPIEISGVTIRAGDLVVGDANGVMVVPAARAADVVAECERAQPIEQACMRDLQAGRGIAETFLLHRGK
jgi:regulator of RNase E activity RraA